VIYERVHELGQGIFSGRYRGLFKEKCKGQTSSEEGCCSRKEVEETSEKIYEDIQSVVEGNHI
jgi:hypothetical protein